MHHGECCWRATRGHVLKLGWERPVDFKRLWGLGAGGDQGLAEAPQAPPSQCVNPESPGRGHGCPQSTATSPQRQALGRGGTVLGDFMVGGTVRGQLVRPLRRGSGLRNVPSSQPLFSLLGFPPRSPIGLNANIISEQVSLVLPWQLGWLLSTRRPREAWVTVRSPRSGDAPTSFPGGRWRSFTCFITRCSYCKITHLHASVRPRCVRSVTTTNSPQVRRGTDSWETPVGAPT